MTAFLFGVPLTSVWPHHAASAFVNLTRIRRTRVQYRVTLPVRASSREPPAHRVNGEAALGIEVALRRRSYAAM
jgi:hypothetical protein